MDNQRLLVWATFGLMAFLTWEAWMKDYGPAATPPTQATQDAAPAADDSLPELADPDPATGDAAIDAPQLDGETPTAEPVENANIVNVVTDVLDLEFSTRGATIRHASLPRYPVDKENPDDVVTLLSPARDELGLLQTGLRAADENAEANHLATFNAERESYALNGGDTLEVPFTWSNGNGITVEKVFRLTRGSYRIDVTQTVRNDSDQPWRGAEYAQLRRHSSPMERSMFDVDSYSFDGPIIYDGEKSTKLDRDELMDDGAMRLSSNSGWVAAIEHHFLTAIIPPAGIKHSYTVNVRDRVMVANTIGSAQTIEPGNEHSFATTLFVGPKLQDQLEEVTPSLKLTVDYGWLTIISEPLFWLLSKVHSLVKNWGVAIIIVTILIKLAFYKLTEASGRSMAKMRKIQPRMKALQERYKDDRQALSQQMMELYKREKVNPAAGCLPILIQMPFFLAFYWVLLESVEMRQAPFALWITDLSSRDPYFILPIIMGAAMLFQQKLNPAPADPVQARVMQIMPIVFTAFFAFFPSGLVLYWVTNTILSIAQQWHINKVVEQEDKRKSGRGKKGKKKQKESDGE